jgi:heparanase 1
MPTSTRHRVRISVNATQVTGVVNPEFVSYTLDWWLYDRNHPGWDVTTSVLTIDLKSSRLVSAAAGLAPAFLRIGGSRADNIIYHFDPNDDNEREQCSLHPKACLTIDRWDEILNFASKVQARVVFTLNYYGYTNKDTMDWDTSKIFKLLNHTVTQHSSGVLYGIELGNEPLHKNNKVKNLERYANSYGALRMMIDTLWYDVPIHLKPKLMGPASTRPGKKFTEGLTAVGRYLDVVTYHQYLGDGEDQNLPKKVMRSDFFHLRKIVDEAAFQASQTLLNNSAQLWVGEGALAYHSGQDGLTNTIASSFWYAHYLGETATSAPFSHSVFCRQTLTGGYYELLDHQANYEPNPDYWTALLWKKLMGTVALGVEDFLPGADALLVHAFCARPSAYAKRGDVSVLYINIDKDVSFDAITNISDHSNLSRNRSDFLLEPHTTPRLKSKKVRLNGELLALDEVGNLPFLMPQKRRTFDPIIVPPLSLLFSVIHNVSAPSCLSAYSSLS